MEIISNIINKFENFKNRYTDKKIKEKENIINKQNDTICELKNRINTEINELEKILVDVNKAIRVLELDVNNKKPILDYRNLQETKMKIKSSIAASKQLLNTLGFKYLPDTYFTIISLKIQDRR